jgi:DNA repair exonuclease SbcCD ATPase subunit
MKLHRLEVEGFGSFAERQVVEFTTGVTYVLGENRDRPGLADSNGAGKTTVLDAISWGLYARTPCGRSKDGVINHLRDEARVALHLSNLHIERSKQRGKGEALKWHTGDGVWKRGDFAPTQQELTETFGISFETFCNTLYLARTSKTVKFLETTPSKRAEVLAELVDSTLFETAAEFIAQDIKTNDTEIQKNLIVLQELEYHEQNIEKDCIRIKQQLDEFTENDRVRRRRVAERIALLRDRVRQERDEVEDSIPDLTMEEAQEQKQAARVRLNDAIDRLSTIRLMKSYADTSLAEGMICPTCRQVLDEDAAVELHSFDDMATEEEKDVEKEILNLEDIVEELDEEQMKIREWRNKQAACKDAMEDMQSELALLQDEMQPGNANNLKDLLGENMARLREIQERKKKYALRIHELEEDLPYLKTLKKAMGTEIRNLLFDRIRTGLEYYTNFYLNLLAGQEFIVSYPSQSRTGREKFEIELQSGNNVQPLEAYSEGENWRATFAILLALRRVLLEGNHADASFLLVDDPIGALDDTGAENFNRLLSSLSKAENIQIIATLPRTLPSLGSDRIMTVVRENRMSYVSG